MPIYVYVHRQSTHCPGFESFQRMAEDPLEHCPECGKEVRRVIGKVSFAFAKSPEAPRKTATKFYEEKLGRKVEKDEVFTTIPASGEVVPLKGLTKSQAAERVHAAHLRAGTPGVTETSKIEAID